MAKTTCQNCGSVLSCSCKIRKASDGKSCCTRCVANYEQQIKVIRKPKIYGKDYTKMTNK